MVELPYPHDYSTVSDYCKSVKPVEKYWHALHAPGQFKTPAQEWFWCMELERQYPELNTR